MGRYLKDPVTAVGYALRLPPDETEPAVLTDGLLRFNTTTHRPEYYYGSGWKDLAIDGKVPIKVQELTQEVNGTRTEWTNELIETVSEPSDILVFIGGVYQRPATETDVGNYDVDGQTITFTSPPPWPTVSSANKIVIIYNINSTTVV